MTLFKYCSALPLAWLLFSLPLQAGEMQTVAGPSGHSAQLQPAVLIHSHNDYHQTVPFYQAYAQMLDSYEADVFYDAKTRRLLVAHETAELNPDNTLNSLYIDPIAAMFRKNKGRPWKNSDKSFYLLIDIKSNPAEVIPAVLKSLAAHPEVFQPAKNPCAVKVVFTGEIPAPAAFSRYPDFIFFDGKTDETYSPRQLERVAFFSEPFQRYSMWNGKGSLVPAEKKRVQEVIEKAHSQQKMIRFWGSPDNLNTWQTFRNLGVDIVNTDHPEACAAFFKNEQQHTFSFGSKTDTTGIAVARADKLDRATRSFAGFSRGSLSLENRIPVYQPTGLNDGANIRPKNVILLIGDGMGLAQLAAADLVNNGLSITRLKYTGFQRTQAKGNFITDSAGAGSALATGEKTPNRALATDGQGHPNASLTERLLARKMACGIVTNGNVADATPAAFYGHADERDSTDQLTACLIRTQPDFLAGSGQSLFVQRKDGRNLRNELSTSYQFADSVQQPLRANQKVIVLDERLGAATTQNNLTLLAQTAKAAITHLRTGPEGFFLMVEGAKIDYAGHANSFPASILETLGFELAVQEALRFADSNGETLVIVTADHETGGLSLIDGDQQAGRISGVYSSDDHTPVFVPVLAYGPGAASFTGVYENTAVFHKIMQLLSNSTTHE